MRRQRAEAKPLVTSARKTLEKAEKILSGPPDGARAARATVEILNARIDIDNALDAMAEVETDG